MPTDAWIAAAKRADRQQVLLMEVESVEAIRQPVTTYDDWAASKSLSNCNIETLRGTVFCTTDGDEPYSGTYSPVTPIGVSDSYSYSGGIPPSDGDPDGQAGYQTDVQIDLSTPDSRTTRITLNFRHICNQYVRDPGTMVLYLSKDGGPYYEYTRMTVRRDVTGSYTIGTSEIDKGHYDIRLFMSGLLGSPFESNLITVDTAVYSHLTTYHSPATLQTRTVDLGLVPAIASQLQVDVYLPAGSSIELTARGSNDGTTWTDLGAVADGYSLGCFRYYDFTAALHASANGLETPELYEIRVIGGNTQFKHIGTHEDLPVPGTRPLLVNSIGSTTSKLELMKLGTIGEISPKMFYVRETFELLRDGYLRDKAITLLLGFKGLSYADYEPIFSGFWYDASVNLQTGTVDIKTRTIWSRFEKVQIPKELAPGGFRNSDTVRPKTWTRVNIISVMLDLLSYLGMSGRFIDTASADAIRTGPRSGDDWLVSRTLDKDSKEGALKLLGELVVLSGVDLIPREDGSVVFELYDPSEEIEVEIPREVATIAPIDLGQAELYTRQQIYYEPRHVNDLETGTVWGSWAPLANYVAGDSLPTASQLTWHCLVSHTSSDNNQPGIGIGWRSVWAPSWQEGASYAAGAKVFSAGKVYTAATSHTSSSANAPGTGTDWDAGMALPAGTVYGQWALGLQIPRNTSIISNGVVWFCLNDHTTELANMPVIGVNYRSYWTTFWHSGGNYIAGEVVIGRGPLYFCRFAHTATEDNEPGHGKDWRNWWTCQPPNKGSAAEDFYNVYVKINDVAEINWGLNDDVPDTDPDYLKNPGYSRQWYDKWQASPVALAALADRMDAWFANPRARTKVSGLPPQFLKARLGKLGGLSGYVLPVSGEEWGVPCSKKKFRIMSRSLDPAKCSVSFDLLEV